MVKNIIEAPFIPQKYSQKSSQKYSQKSSQKYSQKSSLNKSPKSKSPYKKKVNHTKVLSATIDPISEFLSTNNVVSLSKSSRSLKNSLKPVLNNRKEKEIKKIKKQMAKLTMNMLQIQGTRINLIERYKNLLPRKLGGVKINPINIKWPTHINLGKQLQKKFEEMKNNEKSILKKQIEHKQRLKLLQR